MADSDQMIDNALSAQGHLEAAQAQWRVREDELLSDRAEAIRAALDAGAGADNLASALGVGRSRLYAMAKQGRRN